MSSHQGQLPREIFARVFCHVQTSDLLTCLFVCQAWHVSAKPYFYKQIEFCRLSSIDGFITSVQSAPDHPNLLVQKVTFTCKNFQGRTGIECETFREQFRQLVALCPHIEILASSQKLTESVITALYLLPNTLDSLGVFPCSPRTYYYWHCTLRYHRTLRECTLSKDYECRYMIKHRRLKNLPRLQKLFMIDTSVKTVQDVERVLRLCRNLEDLSVKVIDKEDDQSTTDEEDVTKDQYEEKEADNEERQEYPKMKRLTFHSGDEVLDLGRLIHFIRQFSHLERLDLEAVDILTTERPNHQYEELKTLLDIIHALSSASFAVKSANIIRFRTVALQYLQLFFRPEYSGKLTALKLEHVSNSGYNQLDALRYTSNNTKDCKLEMAFSMAYYPSTYDTYVETFAPYVKSLEIDYNLHACESFLDTVLAQCNILHSLTVIHSNCCSSLPSVSDLNDCYLHSSTPTINTSLRTIVLRSCSIEPEFLSSLSYACNNLRQLTIDDTRCSVLDRIRMPKTELEQLDLDLDFLDQQSTAHESLALITLVDSNKTWYFYTNFKKKQYMIPGEKPIQYKGCEVILSLKKIERLRVYFRLDNYQDTMELSEK